VHREAQIFLIRAGAFFQPESVLELGSCDVNGPVRILFRSATRWLGIDIAEGPGVEIVANAATWRSDERFDMVVSSSTFEHTPEWPQIVETAALHCKPGGHVVFSTVMHPFQQHSARDGALHDGEYYQDVTDTELAAAMKAVGLIDVATGSTEFGDVFATATKP
jgi:SAM-dependent methyltransferase